MKKPEVDTSGDLLYKRKPKNLLPGQESNLHPSGLAIPRVPVPLPDKPLFSLHHTTLIDQ
jgi:hypothetical protein